MKNKKANQKLKTFIEKLKANGANFNEAFLEVSEYIPEHFSDNALKIMDEVYKEDEQVSTQVQ